MTSRITVAPIVVAAALVLAAGLALVISRPEVVTVPAGSDLGALAEQHPGAVLQLSPGRYPPAELGTTVTVRGRPGAVVDGPLEVLASGITLEGVRVRGGTDGISIRDARDVRLVGVEVDGAALHGISANGSVVAIEDCRVGAPTEAAGQGIELRNGNGLGRSRIAGCTVTGGQEGIVTHVNRAEVVGNTVTGSTLRGIAIMEMSEVRALDNTVADVAGSAIFCGDMSTCDVRGNHIRDVHPTGAAIRSQRGQAAIAWYYSGLRFTGNDVDVAAAPAVDAYQGGVLTENDPIGIWPNGWRGMLPVIPVSLAALAGAWLLRRGVGALLARRRRPVERDRLTDGAMALVLAGVAVQTFHMIEHVVQVWQIHAADAEIRSGLLGRSLDVEWTHLTFNIGVLVFLAATWRVARRGGASFAGASGPSAWLGTAIATQGYHTLEHVVKAVQHVSLGIDPAPGILGGAVGLVWFHFGINLVVQVATLVAVAALVRDWRETAPAARPFDARATGTAA